MENELGVLHFLHAADTVAWVIVAILLSMSLGCWYVIFTKTIGRVLQTRASTSFLRRFWAAAEPLDSLADKASEPLGELLKVGLATCAQLRRSGGGIVTIGSQEEFLLRALRQHVAEARAKAEGGLTLLASVGAAAPFVGLFGTVWGIYHALLKIGASGQSSLDQVAGPVGEALIMTAFGLAVAIPAVLAYNAFNRANRLLLARLDSFGHDLFALLATGERQGKASVLPLHKEQA